jgi:hypothetical protein
VPPLPLEPGSPPGRITLDEIIAKGSVSVSGTFGPVETDAEKAARLRREERNDNRAWWFRLSVAAVLAVLLVVGLLVALFAESSDRRSFGQNLVYTITGGFVGSIVGYLLGRQDKS